MLHLPYTSMVLSFVVVGAVLSARFSWVVLAGTLSAYFAGLGVGAHFLDQVPGMGSHYVHHWPSGALWSVGLAGVAVGMSIGIFGAIDLREPWLLLLVAVQGLCALGYPLAPVFGGVLHRDSVFAISWGSLPCLTSYFAQAGSLALYPILAAAAFAAVAAVEIRLSRSSRLLRSSAGAVAGVRDAREAPYHRPDAFLRALSVGTTLLALAGLVGRFAGLG